jgi:cell division protein FtsL
MRKYNRPSVNTFVTVVSILFLFILMLTAAVGITARRYEATTTKAFNEYYKLKAERDSLQEQLNVYTISASEAEHKAEQCNN